MKYVRIIVAVLLLALIGVLTLGGDTAPSQVPQEHMMTESDMRGIHIMQDGRVMSGGGMEIPDATIRADGTITLPNGTTVTPSADYRTH